MTSGPGIENGSDVRVCKEGVLRHGQASACGPACRREEHELALVVRAWPGLPEHVRTTSFPFSAWPRSGPALNDDASCRSGSSLGRLADSDTDSPAVEDWAKNLDNDRTVQHGRQNFVLAGAVSSVFALREGADAKRKWNSLPVASRGPRSRIGGFRE